MTNTLWTGDNLYILNGMNSESVDLIYLDPPFNSKRTYSAPVGSKSAGASFKDMWTWGDVDESCLEIMFVEYPALVRFIESIGVLHGKPMMAYITYMTQRIIEMHRVLNETGSFYLHCDPTASHYLKIVLDRVFGKDNFRNEIVWCYKGPGKVTKYFKKKHDIILFYVKSTDSTFNFDSIRVPYKRQTVSVGSTGIATGQRTLEEAQQKEAESIKRKIPEDWWDDIGAGSHMPKHERTGYPTQKPLALLKRIIKASSNKGDIVFDPFCGCATACVAAQQLDRKWIGIDIEAQAAKVLVDRLEDDVGMFKDFVHRIDLPERTDIKQEVPTPDIKTRLYKEQSGLCKGCLVEFEPRNLTIDHIVPRSKGGGDYYTNYQLLCGNCNSVKGNRPMEYLMDKIKKINDQMTKIAFGIK